MSYLQLRFQVQRDRADDLSSALEDLGALSVTWENAGKDDYYEAAYPRAPNWGSVHVTGLFNRSNRSETVVDELNHRFGGGLIPQVKNLDERDWESAYLESVKPRKHEGNLWVCPSWIEPPNPEATNVIIDPGLAFGTGEHPTTAMCLDWISTRRWSGEYVVDYGCGSGVLAIACLLKGAGRARGVDVDPRAVSASALNAARNGVGPGFQAVSPEDTGVDSPADVVIANILSNVLIELREVLATATRPDGELLLTGILEGHAYRVRTAFEPWFGFESRARDGWCLLIGRKR